MKPVHFVWITVVSYLLKSTLSVHFIPERTDVMYVNEKYLYNVSAHVVRYGRKSAYYYNFEAGLKKAWGNNVTVHLAFFEFINNQYKRTFVELHLKLCDMLQHDPYFGKIMRTLLSKYGVSCPVLPGMYHLMNMTLPSENFPNILPFQKGKVVSLVDCIFVI